MYLLYLPIPINHWKPELLSAPYVYAVPSVNIISVTQTPPPSSTSPEVSATQHQQNTTIVYHILIDLLTFAPESSHSIANVFGAQNICKTLKIIR